MPFLNNLLLDIYNIFTLKNQTDFISFINTRIELLFAVEFSVQICFPSLSSQALGTSLMSKKINFEKSIGELEAIVNQLEKGALSLDESLKQFEKGIRLARECQETLSKAEQKIETLTQAEPGSADLIHEGSDD